ncbi:MAG: DUF1501 domain-containing protein [Planctomycetaceae bacterium]|nr:DUF1501 domain-containing protein [Planctomycetaceae bacterium]
MEPLNLNTSAMTRRDTFRLSAGLGLSFLLPAIDLKAAEKRGIERQKSVIVVWLAGGPSQLETWDPHPGTKIGGPTQSLSTKIPGIEIASLFPQTAEQIHHLNIIRSLTSKEGDHERGTYMLKTGYRPDPTTFHPSLGAIITQQAPNSNLEIPQHVSFGDGQWPARGGYLGDQYDAFRIYDPGDGVHNMTMRVDEPRQKRRLGNLEVISRAFEPNRRPAANQSLHRKTLDDALTMMSSEQLEAFKTDDEPESLKKSYGDSRLGRGCLVARRLVESGVRAIEVSMTGFDTHANNYEGMQTQAEILDPGLSTLIRDLKERDLLDSTVVMCLGEFGRTPNINPLDGRDHWPTGFSCLLGGGGLKSGVVIGETDPSGDQKDPKGPVPVENLFATILHQLGIDYEKELITPIGRPMALAQGELIQQLL